MFLPRLNLSPRHYQFPYIKFHGKFYPLVPLTLRRGRYFVNTFALVDSGASISMFRPEIAKALHLPVKLKSGMRLDTASGRVNISVTKVGIEIEDTKFQAQVGFSHAYAASFNIIGREGFFHRFSICFNEIMRTVILVPLAGLRS